VRWRTDGRFRLRNIAGGSMTISAQIGALRELSTMLRRHDFFIARRHKMSLGTILLIILVLMLIGSIPTWPHSREWGYGPSGGLGLVVVILLILWLLGKI